MGNSLWNKKAALVKTERGIRLIALRRRSDLKHSVTKSTKEEKK